MTRRLLAAACLALSVLPLPSGQSALVSRTGEVLAITGVTLIPMTAGAPPRREGVTVVTAGERIVAVGPDDEVAVPAGARVIPGAGKFLLPGLVDLHVHLSKTRASALSLLVANGVTTVRDMGGDHDELLQWRRDVHAGVRVGPAMIMAGPYLESAQNVDRMRKDPPEARVEPFERTRIPVATPADARRIVASLAAKGVDFVKIRTVADRETYLALNEAADAHGLALVGHATSIAPDVVVEAGQDGIDHFLYPSVEAAPERQAVWRRFASRGVPIVPTLSVFFQSIFPSPQHLEAIARDHTGALEPRRRFLSKYLLADWREQAAEASDARRTAFEELWRTTIRRDLREMHAAGMNVLVGTDTAVLNIYPGSSLHDEMALFTGELGMTPHEVLARTTRESARFLRLGDAIGTVERGKIADLVLLDRDPVEDISNTRQISAVILRGRLYDAAGLRRLKTAVLSAPDVRANDWGRTRSTPSAR